ncbi:hypothetical protein VKT23_018151 [Stygiomarasmius scandens]|uniref:Uncharacterized protein n=1 Tax=Marasmiellus scandens TaxID=2682957 RepID=A0ABR1IU61_9AGAR
MYQIFSLHKQLSTITHLSVVVLLPLIISRVVAEPRNVTVDDSDPSIQYSGAWAVSQNNLDNNGSLHFTQDQSASVKFNFTGTAFYYLSPTFPFPMEAGLSISSADGSESNGNIIDGMYNRSAPSEPIRQGGETGESRVVFSSENLTNGQYEVDIGMGPTGGLAFDGFIYTVDDDSSSNGDGGSNGDGSNDDGSNDDGSKDNEAVKLINTNLKALLCVFGVGILRHLYN